MFLSGPAVERIPFMARVSAVLAFILITAVGCQSPRPIVDPFAGRARLAPPGTGNGMQNDPYYQGNGLSPPTVYPGSVQPGTTRGTPNQFIPRGGFRSEVPGNSGTTLPPLQEGRLPRRGRVRPGPTDRASAEEPNMNGSGSGWRSGQADRMVRPALATNEDVPANNFEE